MQRNPDGVAAATTTSPNLGEGKSAVSGTEEWRLVKQPTLVLILLFAITFNFITAELLPMGVLQVMASDLGQTEARIGFLVSIFAFAVVVTSAPLAGIMARLPRRPLLVSILTVLSLGNIAVSFSDSYALDIVIRFVTGIMHGIFWGMIGSLATRMVPAIQRGRALSVIFAGNVAAMSLGIPLSAAAGLLIGWRPSFAVVGVVGLILALLAWRVLPPLPGAAASPHLSLLKVLRTPGVIAISLATLLIFAAHFALYTYVTLSLRQAGVPVGAIAPVLFAFGIVGIVGIWAMSRLVDSRPRLAALATHWLFLSTMVVLVFTARHEIPLLAIAATVLWGLAWSAVPMLFQAAMLRAVPNAPDIASTVLFTAVNLALASGSFIGGKTLDWLDVSWIPALALLLVAGALLIVLASRSGFPSATQTPQAVASVPH